MRNWLQDDLAFSPPATQRALPLLRALDVALAAALLALLAGPLALSAAIGRPRRQTLQGQGGKPFERVFLVLPRHRTGRFLSALGAAQWPVLLNILRGQMSFVGPRPRATGEAVAEDTLAVRPGLVNPWFIRRRTAVDFGTEAQADAGYLAARSLRHDIGLLLRGTAVSLLPLRPDHAPARVQVGDVAFDNVDMNEALGRLRDMLDGPRPQQVSFVNPACVNIAARHRGYRRVLARTGLVLPDGIGIKIGSDLLGTPLKQNVNGTDLFPRLCALLQARGARVFLLGGKPGVAERVAAEIGQRWPGLQVAGVRDGYFGAADEGAVAAQVRASRADVLLVARGVPSQDLFIDRYLPLLGVKLAMGVGGLFDFVSGRIARAPQWMRESGLEWAYRLLQEPGRMWRRYLVGNFSFLARMGLQRLGLRRPAADALPEVPTHGTVDGVGMRAVIFATTPAAADLPVPAGTPAALLPLGCQTVIEQVMDRLLYAEVRDVEIVASDRPEALRALLGDGSRWGLRLRWHLAPDPARPYGVLRSADLDGRQRVLVGHADRCPSVDALQRLGDAPAWAVHADAAGELGWSGWAHLAAAQLADLPLDLDVLGLARAVATRDVPPVLWTDPDVQRANGGPEQIRAAAGQADMPAAWVPTAWGAMSPQARVHPQARITGPVRIGPGCIVARDADIGPGVVLSRNVLVSGNTRIARSVVLPDSYIGPGLDLTDAIVSGRRVRHVALGVETVLPPEDALLLDLTASGAPGPFSLPRLAAGLAWLIAAPALAGHVAARRWTGRAPDWRCMPVVTGRDEASQALQLSTLRCARPAAASAGGRRWALLAGLRDVAAGRRCWVGARPRGQGQWYALRPEWQEILARSPVGLFHARAWADDPSRQEEASAAADVYLSVQAPLRRVWLVLRGFLSPAREHDSGSRSLEPAA